MDNDESEVCQESSEDDIARAEFWMLYFLAMMLAPIWFFGSIIVSIQQKIDFVAAAAILFFLFISFCLLLSRVLNAREKSIKKKLGETE